MATAAAAMTTTRRSLWLGRSDCGVSLMTDQLGWNPIRFVYRFSGPLGSVGKKLSGAAEFTSARVDDVASQMMS